jgi:hypothetical protein
MLIADMPNAPPSMPSVMMVAQANTDQKPAMQREHELGVCELVDTAGTGQVDLVPMVKVNSYYFSDAKIDIYTAKITILQQPKHGKLVPDSTGEWGGSKYRPNDGYLGNDSFIMQVEGNGYTVKLKYFVAVAVDNTKEAFNLNTACKGYWWKISSTLESNFNSTKLDNKSQPNPAFKRDVPRSGPAP